MFSSQVGYLKVVDYFKINITDRDGNYMSNNDSNNTWQIPNKHNIDLKSQHTLSKQDNMNLSCTEEAPNSQKNIWMIFNFAFQLPFENVKYTIFFSFEMFCLDLE